MHEGAGFSFLTTGDVVKEFEQKFSQYLSLPFTIGVTSCTQALMLALMQIGIGEGDEVVTTPMSFIATANAIEYCRAKPVFVDVEKQLVILMQISSNRQLLQKQRQY